jgi:hypothetical protein
MPRFITTAILACAAAAPWLAPAPAAADWDKAERIRRFSDAMEAKIIEVTDERTREKLIHWLKWARSKANWLDPLSDNEDELLGKSRHIFDIISDNQFE